MKCYISFNPIFIFFDCPNLMKKTQQNKKILYIQSTANVSAFFIKHLFFFKIIAFFQLGGSSRTVQLAFFGLFFASVQHRLFNLTGPARPPDAASSLVRQGGWTRGCCDIIPASRLSLSASVRLAYVSGDHGPWNPECHWLDEWFFFGLLLKQECDFFCKRMWVINEAMKCICTKKIEKMSDKKKTDI